MSSRIHVSGYFISFETARSIMKTLEIPDRDCYDYHLHYPINDWLAEQNMTQPLAGTIQYPESGFKPSRRWHGLLLVTHFLKIVDDNPTHAESDADKRVKAWLIERTGVKEEDLTWHGCEDEFGVTEMGTIPVRNDFGGRGYNLSGDQMVRFTKSKMNFHDFLAKLKAEGEHVEEFEYP